MISSRMNVMEVLGKLSSYDAKRVKYIKIYKYLKKIGEILLITFTYVIFLLQVNFT